MNNIDFIVERKKFGEHVRSLRLKIESTDYNKDKISLQELTDKSNNISKKTLGQIERGETNPKFDTLIVLSKLLEVSIKDLMDYN